MCTELEGKREEACQALEAQHAGREAASAAQHAQLIAQLQADHTDALNQARCHFSATATCAVQLGGLRGHHMRVSSQQRTLSASRLAVIHG